MADKKPKQAAPVAQDAKLVGDEAVNAEVRKVTSQSTVKEGAAKVASPRQEAETEVQVHETHVALDEVITDPSSPLAVQIPDAGRGSLDLPLHGLDAPTPEEVFAGDAK